MFCNDEDADKMIVGADRIIFNNFLLLDEKRCREYETDRRSYILVHCGGEACVWLRGRADAPATVRLNEIFAALLAANERLTVSGEAEKLAPVLDEVRKRTGRAYRTLSQRHAYACAQPRRLCTHGGRVVHAAKRDEGALAGFMRLAFCAEQAQAYAKDAIGSSCFFMLKNAGGEIIATAQIIHETREYARLGRVLPLRSGGQAKARLLSEIAALLMAEKITAVLFVDEKDRHGGAYEKAGFIKYGTITEYEFI